MCPPNNNNKSLKYYKKCLIELQLYSVISEKEGRTKRTRKNYSLTEKGKEVAQTIIKLVNIIQDMPHGNKEVET